MSSHALTLETPAADPLPASIDQAFDRIVARFRERGRIDMGSEVIRAALRDRLAHSGFSDREMRLLEVNLMGNLSGWMEFILEERMHQHNVIPDFVRHLRTAFLAHCRERHTSPDEAVGLAIELATAIMELACAFRRQFSVAAGSASGDPAAGAEG
ncbi:MAG: hypothetical protein LBJ46_01290 [Planctomycetota bacterium]|jgi:Arc/MetJ-type ribon-helix-helix transcriptional regulator|nr:hypothetical protein [Planctomycetota bacterium]